MRNDFGPAIDEVLEILNNVTDRLGDDKVTSLLARLEAVILFLAEDVGDFSPAPGFDKTMTGAVAAPITAATGLICDPYQVCARLGATHDDGAMTANFYGGSPDMGKILKEPAHNATLGGEVTGRVKPGGQMQIKPGTGTFELLKQERGPRGNLTDGLCGPTGWR